MLWHRLSLSLLHSLANGNKKLWTAKLCEHVCVFESVCVCERWANSHQTGAETLHLHRPFPACRVIPAPALPPLPSHTYQPPAAVPLPESGSSSLDTMDKQQQLIHLTLYLSLALSLFFFFLLHFSLLLSSTLQVFTFHLISPGNMLLKRVSPGSLRPQSQGTFAQNLSSCNFLPFSAPRVLFNFLKKKNACNIPETCWVDPAPLPFHNFLVTHIPMGQIFYFCN